MKPIETRFEVNPAFVRRVYRALIWRTQGGYVLASLAIAALAVWRITIGQELVLWAFWLGVVATFWYSWLTTAGAVKRSVAARSAVPIELAVADTGITFRGPNSSMGFAWSEVRALHVLEIGLVFERLNGMNPIPVPAQCLTRDEFDGVVAMARTVGVRIR